jgi:hypothetical protein
MDKIQLLKYDPPYGGQAFNIKGIKNGFDTLNKFINSFTFLTNVIEMELTIFEEIYTKTDNYKSNEYIKLANELFGIGNKSQWLNNISNNDLNEYCLKWNIDKSKFDTCIDFVDTINPFPKYYIGTIQISVSYWFKWEKFNFENDLFVNDFFSQNHIMLFLSKRNSIISDFIFPFETINMEFISFYKELVKKLPAD